MKIEPEGTSFDEFDISQCACFIDPPCSYCVDGPDGLGWIPEGEDNDED